MIELTPFLKIYTCVIAFIVGLVMGSFLNCAAIRLVSGEPIAKGRSHCMACGHTLSAGDLVPLFSWIFLKGRCRYCGEKISPRYPMSELVCALIFVSFTLKFGLSAETMEMLVLASLTFCIALCDIQDYMIPDRLIIAGIACRILFVLLSGDIEKNALHSLIGGISISLPLLVIVLLMEKILKKEAMGGGDIKLFFMLGMYFSWQMNLLALIMACIIGIIIGAAGQRRLGTPENEEPKLIPFGPAIACGYFLCALFGQRVIEMYFGLF